MPNPYRSLKLLAIAALLVCTALSAGCPERADRSASVSDEPEVRGYPAVALEYLLAALQSPTKDYPALAFTWSVIAQMDDLPEAEGGAAIRSEIGRQVDHATGSGQIIQAELLAAWLNCAPDLATKYLEEQVGKGGLGYMKALWFKPELARRMFADPVSRTANPDMFEREIADEWLRLTQFWGHVTKEEDHLLTVLSNRKGQPEISLRAAGWILSGIDPGDELLLDYLRQGFKSEEIGPLSGSGEGARFAGDPSLADAIVPLVANVKMGEENPDAAPAGLRPTYGSYALAYLPGDQAELMRGKLLEAADPMVVWHARLGQLLYGDPEPWNAAVAEHGVESGALWVTLEPREAVHPDLLPTYVLAAESESERVRGAAATHLSRYVPFSADPLVVELLHRLQADEDALVREAAWYSAGKVGVGGESAQRVLTTTDEEPRVRLAAAYALLMQAQGGAPEAQWPRATLHWQEAALQRIGAQGGIEMKFTEEQRQQRTENVQEGATESALEGGQ